MVVTSTHENRKCDCCERVLIERNAFLNDGSWQQDFITIMGIDLCYNCAGIIFQLKIVPDLDMNVLKDYILDVRKVIGRNNVQMPFMSALNIPNPFEARLS